MGAGNNVAHVRKSSFVAGANSGNGVIDVRAKVDYQFLAPCALSRAKVTKSPNELHSIAPLFMYVLEDRCVTLSPELQ